jgi:hypothetical protein
MSAVCALTLAACKSPIGQTREHTDYITLAQTLRAHLDAGEYDAARAMMSDDPRRWFSPKEGVGSPWRVGPVQKGPWADWDEHFRKRTEPIEWEAGDHSATHVFYETNDYFMLLDRGWVTTTATYLFDLDDKIRGIVIGMRGERPPGRTDVFLAWAEANELAELAYLMPDGEIDPSGDRPERHRALLNKWRRSAGLPGLAD